MDFTRTSDTPTNAALNYGYGILLSTFNREIVANGYITQLGLFHDNMFNHFNLGSDLMEPFRTLVDKIVYNLKPEIFNHNEKMELINILIMNDTLTNLRCPLNLDTKYVSCCQNYQSCKCRHQKDSLFVMIWNVNIHYALHQHRNNHAKCRGKQHQHYCHNQLFSITAYITK